MKAQELWNEFCKEKKIDPATPYEAWAFGGDDPDGLASLVMRGIKTATASGYDLYELDGEEEEMPKEGDYSVILDHAEEACCVIRTIRTRVIPFDEVDEEQAYKEGEGDRSLAYWRKVHEDFFTKDYGNYGLKFEKDSRILCEEFELLYLASAQQRKLALQEIFTRCGYYGALDGLLAMDQWGGLPEDGCEYRMKLQSFLDEQRRALYVSEEADRLAAYYEKHPVGDDPMENAQVREFLRDRRYYLRVPADLSGEFEEKKGQAVNAWMKAREEQNFEIFRPYMEQVFELRKKIALALEPEKDPFATLLDLTDEGIDLGTVSREFEVLRAGIVDILHKIQNSGVKIDDAFLEKEQDPDVMFEVGRQMARELGYEDSKGGYFDKVLHAFSATVGPRDSRVCFHKHGKPALLYTILHESGHSMYGYSSDEKVVEAGLYDGIPGAFHESQSRFVENFIGRSKAYIHHVYPRLAAKIPDYGKVSEEEFYKAINKVHPSAVRTTADEVTYSLHVIIRFELERDWFAGKITTEQMRDAWNDKYEAYLGVRPENDTQGILQDMHWTGDWIGYFQSYAIGNIYDGQIYEAMQKDIPDMYDQISVGKFDQVMGWLKEHLWRYGRSMTASELMEKTTGKALDAKPFIEYLDKKYGEIYGWNKA